MSGTTEKIKGTVKEAVGKVTGNERLETEGQTDQVKGEGEECRARRAGRNRPRAPRTA